ncbi:unnamed protein product [Ilex paraguariensis]|uniref:Uncharacterized protein n=1 Tax=Ilex paraguariensis TaxID=185542 RepID=A0ABC8SMZ6_9AQUA
MRNERSGDASLRGLKITGQDGSKGLPQKENNYNSDACFNKADGGNHLVSENDGRNKSKPFELYKRRTTVVVRRTTFLDVVCDALAEYKYLGPNQRSDLILACRIRERKESVTVLLCGTSGCGKSTLSALLGSRLGITTLISTDSIRHMMRSFVDEKQNPLLWASTYHAGEYLDPVAVAEAKAKRKAKKLAGISRPSLTKDDLFDGSSTGKSPPEGGPSTAELIGPKQMAVEGFKAQSEMGSRLGITTLISTDSIRHMMRSFVDEKQNPLLWASTYHAGEYLDPVAVAEAKAKRKAKKLAGISRPSLTKDDLFDGSSTGKSPPEGGPSTAELIGPKQMAVEGFKAQSEMVIDSLDRLITEWEERTESVVVEGVHLSLNFVMGLMKKHPSIIPFMIYITNEEKHMERFAVRAKYMTLEPAKNKYVKYIRNIRTIQEYLCKRADKHLVPKINNTNVDKSVAAIHATLFSCLRRRVGEQLYDPITNTVALIDEEYRNQCVANSLSSKGMFQLIQRKGSSRHLMALLNTDGSVAKAWPVDTVDGNGKPTPGRSTENGVGTPMYGPLQIGKAEPINLQFGHFGISAWPINTGGTSHASSVDDSRGDLTDNGSRYYSSCCSSPRASDGPAKELKEEHSVHGSDEEVDDPTEVDSDEDLSDDGQKQLHEEMEGSVDEESTKSDEEYDDLAMQDVQENGYWSDDDEEFKKKLVPHSENRFIDGVNSVHGDKYRQDIDPISRSKNKYRQDIDPISRSKSEPVSAPPLLSYSSLLKEKNEKRVSIYGNVKTRRRSQSIPMLGKHSLQINNPPLSEAHQR